MKTKQVNLQIVTESNYYNQIIQTSEIEWSFLNRLSTDKTSFKELFLKVKCREFFGDLVVCSNLDMDTPLIYGLRLVDKRISLKETLLSVSMPKKSIPNFLKHLPLLRKIEKQMGIKMTRKYFTQYNDENYTKLVLVGDKKWVSSPLLISIYTLIIRSFTYNTPTTSFEDHIKALITDPGSKYGNDGSSFLKLKDYDINLIHLLLNIDEVLDNNPLTGVNDITLKNEKQGMLSGGCISLKYISPNDYINKMTWDLHRNHSESGIVRFAQLINYRKGDTYYRKFSYNSFGVQWVDNYIAICEREAATPISSI